jgi:hypothetical protein
MAWGEREEATNQSFSRRGGCREWWGEERAWARGLGWINNLEWNSWNLVLIRSDMNGIFRSVWIVWFDTYQGALRMHRRTLDWNLWMRTMLEAFADPNTSMAYVNVGRRIVLYTVSLLSRESLDLLLRSGLSRPNFLLRSVRFSLVWGFHVSRRSRWSPRSWTYSGEEEDRRAGPITECEGHVGTLGSIHLDTPSPTSALDTGEMVLGVRIRVTGEDTSVWSVCQVMAQLNT